VPTVISLATSEKQDEIIAGLNFWDKYTPFDEYAGAVSIAADTTADIYSVTGKGYISDVLAVGNNATNLVVIVTVDGTIINEAKLSTSALIVAGIMQLSHMSYAYTGTNIRVFYPYTNFVTEMSATIRRHPHVDATANGLVAISQPLFFNESLLIQIQNIHVSNAYEYTAAWRGGVI
jgi:hypothetical protein